MAPSTVPPPADWGLQRTGKLFGGIAADIRRRLPNYGKDYKDGLHPKVAGATVFLYFACLANAVAFGGLSSVMTHGQIGTVEMIVGTAIAGVIFALFAGQPLTILGGTGPIVIFTALLYEGCVSLGLPFLPVYAWTGVWSGVFLIILAATDASAWMRYFTRFTDEIFAALVAVIFIVEAVKDIIKAFGDPSIPHDEELLTLLLALGTYLIANTLRHFRSSPYLFGRVREFIADFGPTIAIASMTGVALWLGDIHQNQPEVPSVFSTTTERPWLVDMMSVPIWVIFAAAGPALLATILLYLDQNITTRLVNAPSHKLKKGPGYHLDLLVVGLFIAVGSVFGLPWVVAATVHSINHVRSLATTKIVSQGTTSREAIASVRETRISALLIHLALGASILVLPLIRQIPMSVLFGLFLYMGLTSLAGNQLYERVRLWFTDPKLYPRTHYLSYVPRNVIHKFTFIQLACLGLLWVLKTSKLGILFPLLIAMLVPIRMAMTRFFQIDHLVALDHEHEEEEEESQPELAVGG